MQEYTNDEIARVQMAQRALEGFTIDYDDEPPPMTHEQRIAVIGQSPQSLQWFIDYHTWNGWQRGYVDATNDLRPPF